MSSLEPFSVPCAWRFLGRCGRRVPNRQAGGTPVQRGGGRGSPVRVAATVFALLLTVTPLAAEVKVGDRLPDLTGLELQDELPDLAGKVVLVDVWASWCAPCKASFPALGRLQREFADAGFLILAVSVDRKERDYRLFQERFAPPFAVVRDAAQKFAAAFAPPAMPTSYLVDRAGRVRYVHSGFQGERTVRELRDQIRALLEGDS